jgi:hypothetical protein
MHSLKKLFLNGSNINEKFLGEKTHKKKPIVISTSLLNAE